jgi:hypothetical protein
MKNIYVLPTNKPSRLFLNKVNNKLLLEDISNPSLKKVLPSGSYQNIYITADLEIKEGEWFITTLGYLHRCHTKNSKTIYYVTNSGGIAIGAEYCKKVILTTYPDLIADGVQAIDGDFLHWFVKNSSCEYVEVKKGKLQTNDDGQKYGFPDMSLYEIIIPQEPKQENCCTPVGQIKRYVDCVGCDKKPKEKTIEELAFEKYPRSMSEKDSELRNEFINDAKCQKNNYVKYISQLENHSFVGWSEDSINGYLTAWATLKDNI